MRDLARRMRNLLFSYTIKLNDYYMLRRIRQTIDTLNSSRNRKGHKHPLVYEGQKQTANPPI